MVSAVYPK